MGSPASSLGGFSLDPEPVGGQDSLTNYLRSLTNSLGGVGANTFNSGQTTLAEGLKDFQQPLQYYQDILSGNKSSMESAIAPEKQSVLNKYRAARKSIQANNGRSGGTNEAVAQSEFSQAGDIAGLLQKLRPEAAKGEAGIASDISGLGVQESNLGNQQLFQTMGALLGWKGQDNSFAASELGDITSGLSGAFAALV